MSWLYVSDWPLDMQSRDSVRQPEQCGIQACDTTPLFKVAITWSQKPQLIADWSEIAWSG